MKVNIRKPPKDSNKKQRIDVTIEEHDVWSLDYTLSHIIVPSLQLLKQKKDGSPNVDLEDVPTDLHPTEEEIENYTKTGNIDHYWHDRWDYVLDEMIWAFTQIRDQNNMSQVEIQERIQNGVRLFGKYYSSLWF